MGDNHIHIDVYLPPESEQTFYDRRSEGTKISLARSESGIKHVSRMSVLTLSQTTNFRLFQPESVCRQQFLNWMEMAECSPNE